MSSVRLKKLWDERVVNLNGDNIEFIEKVVFVNRVAKVVKGGRRFGFTALVTVGDGGGHVAFALGKATEVTVAIIKGTEQAKKRLVKVPMIGTTIPHDIEGEVGATKVLLMPARPGTGIIAGGTVRAVMECAGIKDVRTKVIGSTTPNNVLNACMLALLKLRTPSEVCLARGISMDDLAYSVQ